MKHRYSSDSVRTGEVPECPGKVQRAQADTGCTAGGVKVAGHRVRLCYGTREPTCRECKWVQAETLRPPAGGWQAGGADQLVVVARACESRQERGG
ncbi:hypothetical protein [Rhodohalobacter sp. 8-1]|uniref:hypothetical protein n=1 Tax=Rhodohalobacter sp. 8-1 TaxID=3131972 RepID=UPI0030EE5CB9